MRIAIDVADLLNGQERFAEFAEKLMWQISQEQPAHHFYLFSNASGDDRFTGENTTSVFVPAAPGRLSKVWRYQFKIPRILRQYAIDVYIGRRALGNFHNRVVQILLINEFAGKTRTRNRRRKVKLISSLHFRAINRVAKVITFSHQVKNRIEQQIPAAAKKLTMINGASFKNCNALDWQTKKSIKEQFVQGCEYFFYDLSEDLTHTINVLKAFSLFKKRQRTNLKLLVYGENELTIRTFIEKLKTYHYKKEVHLINKIEPEQHKQLLGGAYAYVYLSAMNGFAFPVVDALQMGVPVLTARESSGSEVAGDAGLYAEADNINGLADQMKTIFKDEKLRANLIEKGLLQVANFTLQRTAENFWQTLADVVSW